MNADELMFWILCGLCGMFLLFFLLLVWADSVPSVPRRFKGSTNKVKDYIEWTQL